MGDVDGVVLKPPHEFNTPRLRLRAVSAGDAPAIFAAYAQDRDVTRYLLWRPHATLQETEAFLARCTREWASGSIFTWVLLAKDTGALIGMIEANVSGASAELGYVLARPHWNAGYMTEVVRAVLAWAMGEDSINRVWAGCMVDNEASAAVLKKAGFRLERMEARSCVYPNLGEEPRDSAIYSITREGVL